jgi:sugar lactone lactonase YvrE
MKTFNHYLKFANLGTSLLALLLLSFSCSPDPELEAENLKAANAKSKNTQLQILAEGAALKSANGIAIGPDGNLYIASVLGGEIIVMDKNSGAIIDQITDGVQSPDDLVFGPDGSLYWTDILTGEVGRRAPDGTVTKQAFLQGVNPIAFNDEGRLFVALDFLGDGLYEFDPQLLNPPRPIIEASEGNPFPLGFFNSFDFGPDGRLYGPLFAANLVIAVNVGAEDDPPLTGSLQDGFGGAVEILAGLGGEFTNPVAAKFDSNGLLYILDQSSKLFTLDVDTGDLTVLIPDLDPAMDNMVFDDDDGTLYLTNANEGWVAKLEPGGQLQEISPGGMISPQGITVIGGSVFVADQFSLREFNRANGKQKNTFKSELVPVPGTASLISPMNLSAYGNNVIVSSWFSNAVQVYDPRTEKVLEEYPMSVPIDAVRFKDDIIVSALGEGGVVFASDNSMILPIDGEFVFAPGGLVTDGETLWVADWGSGIIWQIDFDGKSPETPTVLIGPGQLSNPEGLALDKEGRLLVVDTGTSRLLRIDLEDNNAVTTVVEGLELGAPALPGFPPTFTFDGVDVTPSGDIYVSGAGANVIYRIPKK